MSHDYDLEEDYAPRVLWGRLAFFLLALVLAFAVGRCTKDAGADPSDLATANQTITDLQSENTVLNQQIQAAENTTSKPDKNKGNNDGDDEATEEPTEDGSVGEGDTYTVKAGDTLTTIAQEVYGDPNKFDLIVDANNLDGTTNLRVGQELIIPADD